MCFYLSAFHFKAEGVCEKPLFLNAAARVFPVSGTRKSWVCLWAAWLYRCTESALNLLAFVIRKGCNTIRRSGRGGNVLWRERERERVQYRPLFMSGWPLSHSNHRLACGKNGLLGTKFDRLTYSWRWCKIKWEGLYVKVAYVFNRVISRENLLIMAINNKFLPWSIN